MSPLHLCVRVFFYWMDSAYKFQPLPPMPHLVNPSLRAPVQTYALVLLHPTKKTPTETLQSSDRGGGGGGGPQLACAWEC